MIQITDAVRRGAVKPVWLDHGYPDVGGDGFVGPDQLLDECVPEKNHGGF